MEGRKGLQVKKRIAREGERMAREGKDGKEREKKPGEGKG